MKEPEPRDEDADKPVDFSQDESVSGAVRRAVREALAGHARRGNKVVVWRDGRPVWIRPKPEVGS